MKFNDQIFQKSVPEINFVEKLYLSDVNHLMFWEYAFRINSVLFCMQIAIYRFQQIVSIIEFLL